MASLWLRSEIKPFEKRAPLVPEHAAELVKIGHHIIVESSKERFFSDFEYENAGCQLVESESWKNAPRDAIILGLKHLSDESFPIIHRHIYFAHAYNENRIFHEKPGITSLMERFKTGGGIHYDIEFLVNERSKRIAAFGVSAGFSGACIALLIWAQKNKGKIPPFNIPGFYSNIKKVLRDTDAALKTTPDNPRILIIGGNGRCGRGVKDVLGQFNLDWTEWGKTETSLPEKLNTVLDYHILFNCSYVRDKVTPFLTLEKLNLNHVLSLIADISCETSGNSPLPIYNGITTYANPTHRITTNNQPLDIMAIDNLPTFLPYECSINFSAQWLPHLKQLLNIGGSPVWDSASKVFKKNIERIN